MDPTSRRLAYTLSEACAAVGIKATKLAELLRDGEIESFTIGRRRLIRADVLEAYVDRVSGRGPQNDPTG